MGKQDSLNKFILSLDGYDEENSSAELDPMTILTTACTAATKSFTKMHGKDFTLEVTSTIEIPLVKGGKARLVGMEELTFKKFVAATSHQIVCVFTDNEQPEGYYIRPEWVKEIFGRRGEELSLWINGNSEINNALAKVSAIKNTKKVENKYEDEEFGAW